MLIVKINVVFVYSCFNTDRMHIKSRQKGSYQLNTKPYLCIY